MTKLTNMSVKRLIHRHLTLQKELEELERKNLNDFNKLHEFTGLKHELYEITEELKHQEKELKDYLTAYARSEDL